MSFQHVMEIKAICRSETHQSLNIQFLFGTNYMEMVFFEIIDFIFGVFLISDVATSNSSGHRTKQDTGLNSSLFYTFLKDERGLRVEG